jgi:hypothetical protein
VRERGRQEEKQLPPSLSLPILAPVAGVTASSSCRGSQSTRGNDRSGGSEGKLMRGREGRGGSACSCCGRSEGQREAMVVLMCLSARKTYIREVQGHYGPVAGLGLLFPFNIFSFFLSPCCYASIFFNGMASSKFGDHAV